MTLVENRNGPLCPNSYPPVTPAHELAVRLQNAAYAAAAKDGEGEMTPESEAIYAALTNDDRMRLYTETDGGRIVPGSRHASVQGWYWRCLICGFVLPAASI